MSGWRPRCGSSIVLSRERDGHPDVDSSSRCEMLSSLKIMESNPLSCARSVIVAVRLYVGGALFRSLWFRFKRGGGGVVLRPRLENRGDRYRSSSSAAVAGCSLTNCSSRGKRIPGWPGEVALLPQPGTAPGASVCRVRAEEDSEWRKCSRDFPLPPLSAVPQAVSGSSSFSLTSASAPVSISPESTSSTSSSSNATSLSLEPD
mmetsp:Transcript_17948/g.45584  ORF Transcript_17948/g.45584 Transcript_17948/m.45584 type:complete len:204 (-) Transcript_17948:193-804(-)